MEQAYRLASEYEATKQKENEAGVEVPKNDNIGRATTMINPKEEEEEK